MYSSSIQLFGLRKQHYARKTKQVSEPVRACQNPTQILFFFFFQFYWDIISIQHHISLRCTVWWFELYTSWSDYHNKFSEHPSPHTGTKLVKEKYFLITKTLDWLSWQFSHVMCVCVSRSVTSNSLQPHGLLPTKLLCPWNSPAKNTGVGNQSLLPNPGIKTRSPTLQVDSLLLSHQGSP